MKHLNLSKRLLALLLAAGILFSMTACGDRAAKPEDSSSAASSDISASSGLPVFINPLDDVDLATIAEPKKPEGDLLEKMNKAYNQNNDVIGWITIPDTMINDPVMFCANDKNTQKNADPESRNFYQRKNIEKAYDFYGSYWADYETKFGDRNSLSQNTIIYGHSMYDEIKDDAAKDKFTQIKKYSDFEWAKKHPVVYYSTAEDDMVWEVFAVSVVDTSLAYNHPEMKDADFMALVSELKARSKYKINVDVKTTDKILLLSTCTYPTNWTNQSIDEQTKYLVAARLVRPGETAPTTMDAVVNDNIKKPVYK